MTLDDVMAAIPSTESADFNEFCRGLKGCPAAGERDAWREVFGLLNEGKARGWIGIAYENGGTAGNIEALILTPEGAARVRAALDAKRGLLGLL